MKGKAILAKLIIMLLVFAVIGCSAQSGTGITTKGTLERSEIGQEQQSEQSDNSQSAEQGSGENEISVIAKSGVETGDEKEAVLDEIAKELDEIINSVNNLDNIEDSDLN